MPQFYSKDSLRFYSKNDIERIKYDEIGFLRLQLSDYEYSEDKKYYIKIDGINKYKFKEKEYDLYKYQDCFFYYTYLCNYKEKKFRAININDYIKFNKDAVFIYKDKYICQYYTMLETLFFFNRNEVIIKPGPSVIENLNICKSENFISRYYNLCNGEAILANNINEFEEVEDEAILVKFSMYYREILLNLLRLEKPNIYKNSIEKEQDELEKIRNIDTPNKRALKLMYLYSNEDFIEYCNQVCTPEFFNKELLKNGEVRKNLKNNFWIYHEFNNSLKDPKENYIEGEDYTFLILNATKALEYLLYRKICNYKEYKKEKYDDKFTKKMMLDNLIYYIEKNREIFKIYNSKLISKENAELIIDSYIKLLYDVKDNCRNGYFHKHRMNVYDELYEKREKVLKAIAETIIYFK